MDNPQQPRTLNNHHQHLKAIIHSVQPVTGPIAFAIGRDYGGKGDSGLQSNQYRVD
jgi:hypothetical protein